VGPITVEPLCKLTCRIAQLFMDMSQPNNVTTEALTSCTQVLKPLVCFVCFLNKNKQINERQILKVMWGHVDVKEN